MKKIIVLTATFLIAVAGVFAQNKAGRKDSAQHILYTCPMHPEISSDMPGKCPKCNRQLVIDRRGSKQASIVYTCPMHPDVVADKPGKCPKCGMDLVGKKSPAHGKQKKDSTDMKMK